MPGLFSFLSFQRCCSKCLESVFKFHNSKPIVETDIAVKLLVLINITQHLPHFLLCKGHRPQQWLLVGENFVSYVSCGRHLHHLKYLQYLQYSSSLHWDPCEQWWGGLWDRLRPTVPVSHRWGDNSLLTSGQYLLDSGWWREKEENIIRWIRWVSEQTSWAWGRGWPGRPCLLVQLLSSRRNGTHTSRYPGILLETLIWTLFWTFVGNLCSYKTKPLIWPKANNQCSVECIQANMLRNQAFFHNLSFPSFCWNVKTNIPSFQGFFLVLQVINWSFSQTWKTFYTFLHFKANCTRWKQILASNINYWSPTNICQLISQSNLELREKRARVFPFRWHQMSHSVAEHMRQSCQVCRGFNQ